MLPAALAALASAAGAAQAAAPDIRPAPARAPADRSQAYTDGCLVSKSALASPQCVYAHAGSDVTVVLFGDSHAMHYFPALERVARSRGWRLVVLTKSGCPPAEVRIRRWGHARTYDECTRWQDHALQRIERERARLVVTSNSSHYLVLEHGRPLHGKRRWQVFGAGYARTLRRLRAEGSAVVAIRDGPRPPFDVPSCVARHLRDPGRCAFSRAGSLHQPDWVTRAIRGVPALTRVDPVDQLCGRTTCRAVIGRLLVYRQTGHLTATFAKTLAGWLDEQLPALEPDARR
jgi:hypothetical protein